MTTLADFGPQMTTGLLPNGVFSMMMPVDLKVVLAFSRMTITTA